MLSILYPILSICCDNIYNVEYIIVKVEYMIINITYVDNVDKVVDNMWIECG